MKIPREKIIHTAETLNPDELFVITQRDLTGFSDGELREPQDKYKMFVVNRDTEILADLGTHPEPLQWIRSKLETTKDLQTFIDRWRNVKNPEEFTL